MTIPVKTKHLKILLIGDSSTGKTSILSRLSKDEFTLKYEPTTELHLEICNISMDTDTVSAVVWDSVGDKYHHTLTNHDSQDADGILLLYDITDDKTFKNITERIEDILELANPKAFIKLVGNKCDLDHQRAVPIKEAEKWAIDRGISFIETSALDASNITTTFQWMIQKIRTTIYSADNISDPYPFSTCRYISNCMKKERQVERCFQELSCDDTQQQRPFHVVLIDLKKAGRDYKPTVHCIEKPLEELDLKYVALSYRWGELYENPIDTHVGYTATITSFDIHDFFTLCNKMIEEVDLKDMDYVWVDAICVDQTNYERRKATIHQMSKIYQRATYILAVPDLHLRYLKSTSEISYKILFDASLYTTDIYYLIHGNVHRLKEIEEEWFNHWKVPKDPQLRQLLKSSTDHFTDSWMNVRIRHQYYKEEECLDHIYESSQKTISATTSQNIENMKNDIELLPPHHLDCHQDDCPLDFVNVVVPKVREENEIDKDDPFKLVYGPWKQRIRERSRIIGQYMKLITSLIEDWASRVWVISEYNIAKEKNNLKYWFVHFNHLRLDKDEDTTFFKFDFEDSTSAICIQDALKDLNYDKKDDKKIRNYPFYLIFHETLNNQLNEKTFLEMMLMSKASKNEDRFYAIFPLSEYSNIITNKAMMDSWKIDTLTSVKLKLFEIINTKEKLNLLYIGGHLGTGEMDKILPTFATSSVLYAPTEYFKIKDKNIDPRHYNFDLNDANTITFHHQNSTLDLPYLNLKPRSFYTIDYDSISLVESPAYHVYSDRTLWSRLQSEDPYETNVIVAIPTWAPSVIKSNIKEHHWSYFFMFLNGNFKNNVWIKDRQRWEWVSFHKFRYWKRHTCDEFTTGFNIY